jgi:hypothetical protein
MIGFLPGLVMLFGYAVLLLVAVAYVGIVFGALLWRLLLRAREVTVDWRIALVGTVLAFLLGMVPLLGWLLTLVLLLDALGGIAYLAYRALWVTRRGAPA